jgi:hypothetical protein
MRATPHQSHVEYSHAHADVDIELLTRRVAVFDGFEAFKAATGELPMHRPDLKRERRDGADVWTRNGIIVPHPDKVRWLWARFSDPSPDLEGESVSAAPFRQFADDSVRKWGGWIDMNHWSRPQRFPEQMAKAGRSPEEYVIGKLTEIRVSGDDTSYAEGYLWPEGVNEHADTAAGWLRYAPDMVHCSAGGPIVKGHPQIVGGRKVVPVQIFLNHLAIALQGVHNETAVKTTPFGEFYKALADGISETECAGDSSFAKHVRGMPEGTKAMTAAAVAPAVPEDLEGAKTTKPAGPRDVTDVTDCDHWIAGTRKFHSTAAAHEHLTRCCGWPATRARDYLAAATRS